MERKNIISAREKELQLEMKRYEWNVLGICEMRWLGIGDMMLEDKSKVCWNGEDKKHQKGVGMIV